MNTTLGSPSLPPMGPTPPARPEQAAARVKTVATVVLVIILFVGISLLVLDGLAHASAGGGCGGG